MHSEESHVARRSRVITKELVWRKGSGVADEGLV